MRKIMDDVVPLLAPCQQQAIDNIRAEAIALRSEAASIVSHISRMSNLSEADILRVKEAIRQHARIALHFHPDRPAGSRLVAEALLEDGVYKTQFETGISNGLVEMQAGGLRDEWERHLFKGAYQTEGVSAAQRPRYAALDLMRSPDGPAPRFGSCFFILKPNVTGRSTFTFGGSQDKPKNQGTVDELDSILAALMEESFTRDCALGLQNLRPAQLVDKLCNLGNVDDVLYEKGTTSHNLDHVIEAQVHGEVRLGHDVEALVIDPAFHGTEVGQCLTEMANVYGFALHSHRGFALRVRQVPSDFRGCTMPSLAARISKENNEILDTACIGKAAQSLAENPELWEDRGLPKDVLQELKLLWHVLVKYGQPLEEVRGG